VAALATDLRPRSPWSADNSASRNSPSLSGFSVTRGAVGRFEAGTLAPRAATLDRIAKAGRVSNDWLLRGGRPRVTTVPRRDPEWTAGGSAEDSMGPSGTSWGGDRRAAGVAAGLIDRAVDLPPPPGVASRPSGGSL